MDIKGIQGGHERLRIGLLKRLRERLSFDPAALSDSAFHSELSHACELWQMSDDALIKLLRQHIIGEPNKCPAGQALAALVQTTRQTRMQIALRTRTCGDAAFRAWHRRQVNRCEAALGSDVNGAFTHIPIVWELSSGCSVGCPFCGLSAQPLQRVFRATESNLALFEQALAVSGKLFGAAAADAVLYYCSEPMDCPDYPVFARRFLECMGRIPMMTTAVPLRSVEKTRSVLALGTALHRFSLLTLDDFHAVMAAFSPEELLHTELLPRYPEAGRPLVHAGRAAGAQTVQTTISCISGFAVNMAEQSVRLLTPCPADEKHPNGEMVLELGRFDSAAALELLLRSCMEQMTVCPLTGHHYRLWPYLKLREAPDAALISRSGLCVPIRDACILTAARELANGTEIDGLARQLEMRGFSPLACQCAVQALYNGGFLEDEGEDLL